MQDYFKTLESTVKSHWDSPALCNYRAECFTYCDLASYIEKFHIFFEKAGLGKGAHMSLCAKNTARWGISFLSINTYEAVVVPILSDFTPESVSHLVDHSNSVILFTDKEIWEKMDKDIVGKLRAVICVNDFTLLYSVDDKIKEAYESIDDEFKTRYPMGFNRENVHYNCDNQEKLAVINYTSGTTSAPKGVMLRHECFSATIDFSEVQVPTHEGDKVVSMLPMGHIYGLVIEFLYPLCHGVTVYFLGKTPSPTLLLKAMKDIRPYMVVTVPLVMEKVFRSSIKPAISKFPVNLLLHFPVIGNSIYKKIGRKLQEAFGGQVRVFIMGGAALNPDVEKVFKKIRLPYTVGYGMTEAAPLLAWDVPENYAPGSCGKAVSTSEIRIDSEDPQHIAGEIQARGMNICSGYYHNSEASENAFTEDGFLHTGDLGIMDEEGNIFIKGRSKNMILSANGQNIYPEEVEAVVNSQDYVAESVVVDRHSKLVALVYLDDALIKKAGLDQEAIADIPENIQINSNRTLPPYSRIAKVEIVLEPFEKTPKMSIKRFLYK